MFNFLRTRSSSIRNACVVSTRTTMQCSTRLCSFCNFYHLKPPKATKNALFRYYATIDTELQTSWKKKVKRRSKKYAELLEVTDQTTNNRKAAVRKLNSNDVSILVGQSNITLDKLHKISNFHLDKGATTTESKAINTEHDKNLVCAVDKTDVQSTIFTESDEYLKDKFIESQIVEDLKESGLNDHTTLIKDSTFLCTLQSGKNNDRNENQNDIAQMSRYDENSNSYATIPFTKEADQFEGSLSDQNLVLQLLAHMDIHIQTKMANKAVKILMSHRQQLKHSRVSTVILYNLLIESYTSIMHLEKAFEVYKMMKVDCIKPNSQTYALMFQMLAKIKHNEIQAEYAAEVMADMNSMGITFDEIMNNSWMNAKQRNIVLQYIKSMNPEYHIKHYRGIDVAHSCKLLRNVTVNSNYQSPAKGLINMDMLQNMLNTQVNMEKQCELEIKNIAPFTGNFDVRQQAIEKIAEWEESWKSAVSEAFERNIIHLKQKEIRMLPDFKILHPFLQVLPKDEYVNAILREINQLARFSEAYSISTRNLYIKLGRYIYMKYQFQRKTKAGVIDSTLHIYKKYLEWYMDPSKENINGRMKWQWLFEEANRSGVCSEMLMPEWPRNVLLNVGKFLYNIIINNVKISHVPKPGVPERQIPAFYLLFRSQMSHLTEEIKPHPHLHRLYKDSHPETLTFETTLLPMCCPPRPWVDIDNGGYLFSKSLFMRNFYMTPTHMLRDTPTQQLYPEFDSLNQLGSIPWRINVPVLNILIQIFQDGGSEKLGVPQPPEALPLLSKMISSDAGMSKQKISRLALQLKRKKSEMYSLWCDCLYKLSLANYFRDKVFWLPHNLDFRGRAYPVPPHMTHLSSDLARSILTFAQGKPLGPDGLDWLKLHAINLSGMKKRESIHERLKFANEILDLIVDSARNPLTGKMWWTKSDEPWQTLAACKEIDNALRSPNPQEYISRFPIHQDGSCNGLQHYAALGRDQIGAESVNLYPVDTPQDVYSVVAGMVEEYRTIDAEAGNEIAKALKGHISRKVIKQTVMTTVYGVTKFGARLQIARQLSDLKEFNQDYTWSGSLYLADKTFLSIRTMFTSAREIQDWFTECARVISTRCNQYVQWITPLGLPIIQPYSKRALSSKQKHFVMKPDTMKQKNAFPPNFIHSLDSSHMMLTSIHCEQAGITFMSVHDCFWTHPSTVDIMNRICREQFIALHCEPILEDLSKFLCKRYENYFVMSKLPKKKTNDFSIEVFKKLPQKGDFDINKVLSSRYFFS